MMSIRSRALGSWFDPKSQPGIAFRLGEKLIERCQGRRMVIVTLTFDRTRFTNAAHCYEMCSKMQIVPRFIRRLELAIGCDLTGRWWRKLEFQEGGWVHYHMILDVPFVDHDELTEAWGHGHVWIERVNPSSLRYVCKYVSKSGELPEYLKHVPSRSVKVTACSPGWWPKREGAKPREPKAPDPSPRIDAWKPMSVMLASINQSTVVRDCGTGKHCVVPLPTHVVVHALRMCRGERTNDQGWWSIDIPSEEFWKRIDYISHHWREQRPKQFKGWERVKETARLEGAGGGAGVSPPAAPSLDHYH